MWHSSLYHGVGEVRIGFDLNPHFEFNQTLSEQFESRKHFCNIWSVWKGVSWSPWVQGRSSDTRWQHHFVYHYVYQQNESFFLFFLQVFLRIFYAKDITRLLFDKWMLSHLRCVLFSLFFCHLECWEPEKCHASLPLSCLFSADVEWQALDNFIYFGFVTIPYHKEGCIGKYSPRGSRDLPKQGFCTPRPSFLFWKIFSSLFFTFLSFLLTSFSQSWSCSVLFPLTCRVGGMGSQAGLATSRQASYVWLWFKKMLK